MVDRMPIPNPTVGIGLAVRLGASLLLAIVLSTVAVGTAIAQSAPPSDVHVSFTADRSELTVGDPVTLSLVVQHAADLVVVLPRLEREWGSFEVQDQSSARTVSADDGMRTTAKEFHVTLFAPGAFETPGLSIAVLTPDGNVEQVLAHPVRLNVTSVLSGPDETLRDIRPPADLSASFWERYGVPLLIVLAILAVLGAPGYHLYQRSRGQADVSVPEAEPLSPWEAATRELDLVRRLDLPGSGDMKGHYTLVVDALRTYLGATHLRGRGPADGTDMSTEEATSAVRQSTLDAGNVRVVIDLLQEADLVKFADYVPPASRAYEAEGQVRDLVETDRLSLEGDGVPAEASAQRGGGP